jgi:acyl-CoA thioesterase-1
MNGQPSDLRVLFFGDSLVAGVCDPAGKGWVGRVVAACFAEGLALTAYNLGVRGETSQQGAARWRAESLPRLLPSADARIVLSFGANDTTVEGGRLRVEIEQSCSALSAILEGVEAVGARALMIGPAPVDDPEHNERIRTLSAAFADVCHRAGVPFVSVVEPLLALQVWMAEVAGDDGAHPAAEGYEALSRLVIAAGWTDWLRGA